MQIKTINDYVDALQEKFPGLSEADIKRILNYGWRTVFLYNSYGGDTVIRDESFWCYIGTLKHKAIDHFKYYIDKLVTKLRILFNRKKIEWDGYHYFALTDAQYEQYEASKTNAKKYFIFNDLVLYKLLDECKIAESNNKYIFKVTNVYPFSFKKYYKEIKLYKPELIITREPLKFSDIIVNENDYEVI